MWVYVVVIAAIAVIIWLMIKSKEDISKTEDESPEKDRTDGKRKAWDESEEAGKKETGAESKEAGGKGGSGLAYGRGMKGKSGPEAEEAPEKEWEAVDVYTYHAEKDTWRCIYCDGENSFDEMVCRVCGKEKNDKEV